MGARGSPPPPWGHGGGGGALTFARTQGALAFVLCVCLASICKLAGLQSASASQGGALALAFSKVVVAAVEVAAVEVGCRGWPAGTGAARRARACGAGAWIAIGGGSPAGAPSHPKSSSLSPSRGLVAVSRLARSSGLVSPPASVVGAANSLRSADWMDLSFCLSASCL
jgi:hypothetical protein